MDGEQARPLSIDTLPCGVCRLRVDDALTILTANRYFYDLFGYEPEILAGRKLGSIRFLTYPSDWSALYAGLEVELASGREAFQLEAKAVHRSGRVLWMLLRCSPVSGMSGILDCIVLDISERIQTMERLKLNEEERQLLLKHTGRFAFRFYLASHTAVLPSDTAREMGMSERVEMFPDQAIQGGWCAPESRDDLLRFFSAIQSGEKAGSAMLRLRNGEGEYTWYSFAFSMVCNQDGRHLHAVVSFEDVSQQREREVAYEKWSQYNQSQLQNAVVYYECNLTRNLLEKLDGYTAFRYPQTALVSYDDMLRYVMEELVWPEDRELYLTHFQRSQLLAHYHQGGRELSLECRRLDSDNSPFWVQVNVQILPDPFSEDVKAFILVRDVNEEKCREIELRDRSQKDPLTGVLNRGAFVERMDALLSESLPNASHALVMLDVDRFKDLNDTLGHQFGDKVLTDIADVLRNAFRSDDLIGRLGGDEFVLCLKNMPSRRALADKMASLCGQLSLTFANGGHTSGSLGGALFPEDGACFDELYHRADQALYQAKRLGRGRFVLYDAEAVR